MKCFSLLVFVGLMYSSWTVQARTFNDNASRQLLHQHHVASATSPPFLAAVRPRGERLHPLCTEALSFRIQNGASDSQSLTTDEVYSIADQVDAGKVPHIRINIKGLPCAKQGCCEHNVLIRSKTSDILVLHQAIHEYRDFLDKLEPHFEFKSILDAGGNIGIATVLFAHLFPEAVVVALEPQAQNCFMLKANTLSLPNVRVHCMGLWDKVSRVAVVPGIGGDWAWHLEEVGEDHADAAPTTTIPQLILDHELEGFDFVKSDIEGAEFKVFGKDADLSWTNKTSLFALEVHDWAGDRADLESVFTSRNLIRSRSGEYAVFATEPLHAKLT